MSVAGTTLYAQIPEKVGSLLQADKDAAALAKASTPHQAFLSIIDKESTFYVPSAVNAYNYLNNRPNIPDVLNWQPTFALIAKSQEFGVTSGSMDFQKVGARLRHGEYLTVWKVSGWSIFVPKLKTTGTTGSLILNISNLPTRGI